jgi:DNA-binding transcriptional MerR regulator
MTDRTISIKGIGNRLDEWEEKLVDLKARAQEAKEEEKDVHVEKIDTLHHKTRQLKQKLNQMEEKAHHKVDWEKELKAIEHALKDLDEEYRETWAYIYH